MPKVKTSKFKKQYVIGENRILVAKKDDDSYIVSIRDTKTEKAVDFPVKRWASFVNNIDVIDEHVKMLRERKYVKLCHPIGGGWYVSVTMGIWCVDVRKFYMPFNQTEPKPTRTGFALRLREWDELKTAIKRLHVDVPDIASTLPCYHDLDHAQQESLFLCSECNPFFLSMV
jgi:hypothetical protein